MTRLIKCKHSGVEQYRIVYINPENISHAIRFNSTSINIHMNNGKVIILTEESFDNLVYEIKYTDKSLCEKLNEIKEAIYSIGH